MGVWKALALTSIAAVGAMNVAKAADLLPPPPMVEARYADPGDPGLFSGWYLRGDVGAAVLQLRGSSSSFTNTDGDLSGSGGRVPGFAYDSAKADTTALIGAGFGYQFNNYFRADFTGEYRFGASYLAEATASGCNTAGGGCADKYTGKISSAVFLANGYFDLGTWYRLTPYIGAGVGVAINNSAPVKDYNILYYNTLGGTGTSNTNTSLAYALMAGVSYSLTSNIKLDFGYRYLDLGMSKSAAIQCIDNPCFFEKQEHHLSSHDIRLGLRYVFNDDPGDPGRPLLPPPPPPLVRKY